MSSPAPSTSKPEEKYSKWLAEHYEQWFINNDKEFRPDFRDPEYKYQNNFIYCDIPGYELEVYDAANDPNKATDLMFQPWRRPHKPEGIGKYEERKALLKDYMNNYRTRGYQGFAELLWKMWGKKEELKALEKYFEEESQVPKSEAEVLEKFANVVSWALKAEDLIPHKIYRLVNGVESATFSQNQCAAILSWMFFLTTRYSFEQIICGPRDVHVEKLKFLFNYFESVLSVPPGGTVSFRKNVFTETQSYLVYESKGEFNVKLMRNDMKIEDTSLCTQVDFANKNIGGGVLRGGAVQEEIRFLMCPEMMVSMLLCNTMDQFDSISIIGAQAFSSYSGYSSSLKWEPLSAVDAVLNEPLYRDHYGRLRVETIAIDAIKFVEKDKLEALQKQCDVRNVYREYFKTMSGFTSQGERFPSPIVSGWWGCGVFGGNKPLKFLIQACAAARAGRPLWICPFGEDSMAEKAKEIMTFIKDNKLNSGDVMSVLLFLERPKVYSETYVFDKLKDMVRRRLEKKTRKSHP